MTFPHRFCRLIAGIAFALFLSELALHAAFLPLGFVETQYGANLGSGPTAMEFAPDGRLFVCLQGGQLLVISNGTLLATPFVRVDTTADGERGLLGVAFDPNFGANQFVYVYYTVNIPPIHNRVSRFTANGDVAVPGSETIILDLDNLSNATNHNGGAIHFGPDGKLYVGVGENADPPNAQSLTNRLGKMLRINADGTIPSDNPTTFPGIAGSTAGANRAIWAVGLRNPYTFAFRAGTGRMFINDVGQNTWEEINDGLAGSNYGWNVCEGFCSPPDPNYRDPLFQYGHGGGNTAGCAIVGGTFYNPSTNQFPASYIGKYFFADLCSGWIRVFDPFDKTASDFATGISVPVDLKVDSGGSLYYLAQGNGGQVFQIQSTLPTPTPPATANISGNISYCSNPNPGPVAGVTLNLTGTEGGSTLSDSSGNYQFLALASGGSYTVTPTKVDRAPGSAGINTLDVIAVQKHFLGTLIIPPGCRLTAAEVSGAGPINTLDAIAIQRFFLGQTGGIGKAGKYQFAPVNRLYSPLVNDQTGQNFDALIFGDVTGPFADRASGPSHDAAGDDSSAAEVPSTVAAVALPDVAVERLGTPKNSREQVLSRVKSMSSYIAAVTTSAIDARQSLIGFQGDFTFDERMVTFDESQPVQPAGLTANNWNVSGNVLDGPGPIRTLRISAYSNVLTPLSGTGTLFELRMSKVSKEGQSTELIWAAPPNHFIFIDADLKTQTPSHTATGRIAPIGGRK